MKKILFGVGCFWSRNADWIMELFHFDFLCDNDSGKTGKYFKGIKCLSIDEIVGVDKDIEVYIGIEPPVFHEEVRDELQRRNVVIKNFCVNAGEEQKKDIYLWGNC